MSNLLHADTVGSLLPSAARFRTDRRWHPYLTAMLTPIVTEIRRHGNSAPAPAPPSPAAGIQVPRPRADVSGE